MKPDTKLWKTIFLSRSYFTIKNSGNGVSNQNIVESRSTMLLIKTNFFYLNKWDLNNSYLDNQQLLKPIRNLLNHYIKKAHGFFASDFENIS
jgi:hypothetical protein